MTVDAAVYRILCLFAQAGGSGGGLSVSSKTNHASPAHLLPQLAAALGLAALGHNPPVRTCHLPPDCQPNSMALLQQQRTRTVRQGGAPYLNLLAMYPAKQQSSPISGTRAATKLARPTAHLAAHGALIVPQLQHTVDAAPSAGHALATAAACCAAILPAQNCALQLAVQLHQLHAAPQLVHQAGIGHLWGKKGRNSSGGVNLQIGLQRC